MEENIFTKGLKTADELERFIDNCVEKDVLKYDVAMEHIEIIQAIRDYIERLKEDTKPF